MNPAPEDDDPGQPTFQEQVGEGLGAVEPMGHLRRHRRHVRHVAAEQVGHEPLRVQEAQSDPATAIARTTTAAPNGPARGHCGAVMRPDRGRERPWTGSASRSG